MPTGRTHTSTTLMLAGLSVCTGSPAVTLGILTGLIISPDQDCDDGFIGLAHLRRIPLIGRPLSWCWRGFWWFYSKVVPHRSNISHSIFFGTCVRVAYLMFPLLILNYFGWEIHLNKNFGLWFLGLCLSDTLHIILDFTVKGRKVPRYSKRLPEIGEKFP